MTTPLTLHNAVVARLRTLVTVRTYDGEAPDDVPTDRSGKASPYVVVWPSVGSRPWEQPMDETARGGLTWPVRVTVAAGSHVWAMQASHMVLNLLDGWRPVPGSVLTEDVQNVGVLQDLEALPPRWWVPLMFKTTT